MKRTVGPFSGSVVVPVRVASAGRPGPSAKEVRGSGWRRTSRGFYVPVGTPRTPQQRVIEASMVVPVHGGLTGWAALRWMGGRWFEGTAHGGRIELPVSVSVPRLDIRAQPGIAVRKEPLPEDELTTYDGLRLTTADRAVIFEMRHAPSLVEAVVAADMGALSDLVSISEGRRYLSEHVGLIGNSLARQALAFAHENSWSPMETRLRMLWLLTAALPPPLVNAPVFDLDGHHLGTPDMLDLEAGLAIEYDSTEYHQGARRLRDSKREDALRGAGLNYVTVLKGEFRNRVQLAERRRRARLHAMSESSSRRWTTEPPPTWELFDTVERRRASRRRFGP